MAVAFDELENNPFYIALETKYIEKCKEAQKKIWHICVPFHKSLKNHVITKDFIDNHILKPSPFFKSHFVTTDLNNSSSFEIEDSSIKTKTDKIKILMEETAYNDDYKPYKILIIERPLSCMSSIKDEIQNTFTSKTPMQTFDECATFLQSYSQGIYVLKLLDKKIQVFNSSYMVLPQYLQDASVKLKSILYWANLEFFKVLSQMPEEKYCKTDISAALENYIMFQVHDKVFPVVKKFCFEKDKKLTQKLKRLYDANVTPTELGVREAFCCQTPTAIAELSSLNSRNCPVVKVNCLLATIELLNHDINTFYQETCYPVSNKEVPIVTSDDLIPLLVNIIVHSRPESFISNLYYIETFCWETSPVDKLSFGLVTFQAAVEFLKSNDFESLKSSTRKVKKDLSLEELKQEIFEIQSCKKSSIENKRPTFQSPTDHLLENVSKMLETTAKNNKEKINIKDISASKQRRTTKSKPQETVGDFLSSLRQNTLGLSYGKQT